MFDIEIIKNKGFDVIDSKLLHKELSVASYHKDWIRRRIDGYGFEEGTDYFTKQCSTLSGGSKRKDYLITLDMAKELCMLENNDKGKATRKYFIAVEKDYRKQNIILGISLDKRKSLTDAVKDSGEQLRMHNHVFSTYTLMVYKFLGIKKDYQDWKKSTGGKGDYRKTLSLELRERIANAETFVRGMLELQKQHGEIKAVLEPLFKVKEII
jgi:phage anti-repressor protein